MIGRTEFAIQSENCSFAAHFCFVTVAESILFDFRLSGVHFVEPPYGWHYLLAGVDSVRGRMWGELGNAYFSVCHNTWCMCPS